MGEVALHSDEACVLQSPFAQPLQSTTGFARPSPVRSCSRGVPRLHENAPPYDPTGGLCLGPYGGPRGGDVSYERGTPVPMQQQLFLTCKAELGRSPGYMAHCSSYLHID